MFVGVAEDVVVEEWYQCPERAEGYHCVDVEAGLKEDAAIERARYRAQAGGQAVDAVDEVDGVGYEDGQQDGEKH